MLLEFAQKFKKLTIGGMNLYSERQSFYRKHTRYSFSNFILISNDSYTRSFSSTKYVTTKNSLPRTKD